MDNTNADEENLSRIYNNRQKTKKSDQFGLTHAYHQHHEEPRYHLKSSLELKMEEMSGDWTLQTLTEKKKKKIDHPSNTMKLIVLLNYTQQHLVLYII